jgi:myo-inositol 2-dehydrogenase/D-chiro-inositol 1-dehydrogenase
MAEQNGSFKLGRRAFLAGAAATTFTLMKPSLIRGTEANSVIELGMIGCGGRGTWIARLFQDTGKYRFVACADYFQDRINMLGSRFSIPAERRYGALSGYRRLLESKLDAVAIESPPYFHPEQAAAAVDAGKHVYLAKPVAIDVPGCSSIAESGKKATDRKLVFLVDFQTRANELYREAVRRVHGGDIGKIVCGEAHYPWQGSGSGTDSDNPEERLRHWYSTLALSGDVIVEQDIHALDVATWFLDADPLRASGTGGRAIRKVGNIWDHFSVTYGFPQDITLTFTSVKMIPGVKDEIRCRIFGSDGMVHTDYFGEVWMRGKKPYEGGSTENLYTSGALNNIEDFHRFVTGGNYANTTVAPSVRSNLTSVLGREAAYSGKVMTWDEVMRAGVKLEPDLRGLKS